MREEGGEGVQGGNHALTFEREDRRTISFLSVEEEKEEKKLLLPMGCRMTFHIHLNVILSLSALFKS